jgi:hypothetical protein
MQRLKRSIEISKSNTFGLQRGSRALRRKVIHRALSLGPRLLQRHETDPLLMADSWQRSKDHREKNLRSYKKKCVSGKPNVFSKVIEKDF